MDLELLSRNRERIILFIWTSVRNEPHKIEDNPISSEGVYAWDYVIGNETVALKLGETEIIGVYRQGIDSIRTYNLVDENAIKSMINENKAVHLLKIKVDERKE
ncbi:MAG: hypothetical protein FH751_00040 [Firmicutes bacterium]|nr:hypothetical protein [Bacillota bacterium]